MATQVPPSLSVSRDQALTIAKEDAEKAYVDLKPYRVTIKREADGWHVDYELIGANLQGGGPHYIIDMSSGAIKSKR